MNTEVVFVGLGEMGFPMALNLVKSGIPISGYDLLLQNVNRFVLSGGKGVTCLAKAVHKANVVITMLPANQVALTYFGERGVLANASPSALLIDCSAVDPECTERIASSAASRGLSMLDAPTWGGTAEAATATLTFLVGGPADGLKQARPYLEKMGRTIHHMGPAGSGQKTRMANDLLWVA